MASLVILVVSLLYFAIHEGGDEQGQQNVVIFRFKDSLNDSSSYSACTIDTCIDLLPCSIFDNRLSVFVEPLVDIINEVNFPVCCCVYPSVPIPKNVSFFFLLKF